MVSFNKQAIFAICQGMTLLHWACDRGHEDVVRYLIKNKAEINAQVGVWNTSLFLALLFLLGFKCFCPGWKAYKGAARVFGFQQ